MGCVSSKFVRQDIHRDIVLNHGGDCLDHVVSLTSTTYGALKLDNDRPIKEFVAADSSTKRLQISPSRKEAPEVINAWELMEGLEDGMTVSSMPKKSPKGSIFLRGLADMDARTPLKFLNQMGSPKTVKKSTGKENRVLQMNWIKTAGVRRLDYSPKGVLKPSNASPTPCKSVLNSVLSVKGSPVCTRRNSFGSGDSSRRSPSPLFDPQLLGSYEKELSEEEEHIKRMVSPNLKGREYRNSQGSEALLQLFKKKCPQGGDNAVVLYTTTLRGIRKTYEECNKVRAMIESYQIHIYERDISMDSGLKEELRRLMGKKEVKVPVVFVKGRLIGGAEEVFKLEEEGKLDLLFDGIPRAVVGGCEGCGGIRFVMCMECNGSCKVLGEEEKNRVRCSKCNENGLIKCSNCC